MKRLILAEISLQRLYSVMRLSIVLGCLYLLHACSSMSTSSWFTPDATTAPTAKPSFKNLEAAEQAGARPRHLAVLLPNRGPFAAPANSIRTGMLSAKQEDQRGNMVSIRFYDTSTTPVSTVYTQAINEGADFVIGPLTKEDVTQLLRTTSIKVPTLALNYTNASRPAHFYEIGLMPEDEIAQMLTQARKQGLSRALLIAPQSSFGTRLTKPLAEQWRAKGGYLVDTLYFTPRTRFQEAIPKLLHIDVARDAALMKNGDRDKNVLESQRRQDFDVIFLVTKPAEARAIVPVLRYFYVNNVPIYAPSSVYATPDPIGDVDLNGIHVCDIPASQLVDHAPNNNHRFYALGRDAYLISQSINQLEHVSGLTLPGETGELSLNNRRQIQREITCGTMRNGYLSPT